MHDPPHLAGALFLQNPEGSLESPAAVDQHRQPQRDRQAELIPEGPFLLLQGYRIIRIKPDLADGHSAAGNRSKSGKDMIIGETGVHGMNAESRINPFVPVGQ